MDRIKLIIVLNRILTKKDIFKKRMYSNIFTRIIDLKKIIIYEKCNREPKEFICSVRSHYFYDTGISFESTTNW